jgi:hypothetical protein
LSSGRELREQREFIMSRPGSRSGELNETYDERMRRIVVRIAAHRQVPVVDIQNLLDTPSAFESWLVSQPPEAVVGDYFTPDDSPLANFLWDALGVYVDTADTIFEGKHFIPMPAWCRVFTRYEAEYIEAHTDEGDEFSAADVLSILREAVNAK